MKSPAPARSAAWTEIGDDVARGGRHAAVGERLITEQMLLGSGTLEIASGQNIFSGPAIEIA